MTSLHAQVALDFVRAGGAGDAGWTWVHLRRDHPGAEAWLQQVLSIDEARARAAHLSRAARPAARQRAACSVRMRRGVERAALVRLRRAARAAQASREALLSTDSRPRCMPGLGRSVLLRLRGLHRRYRPAGERDAPPAAPLPADEECPPEPVRGGANGSANGGAASSPAAGAQHTAGALEEYNDLYAITLLIQPDKARCAACMRARRGVRCSADSRHGDAAAAQVVSSAEVSLEAVRHARELLHEARAHGACRSPPDTR